MLVLLPPSETKRPGGDRPPLDVAALALPTLREPRERVIDALVALSADEGAAARVLKLSAARRHEIADNAALRTAPTMPAVDRYTGVLYDALSANTLDGAARRWLDAHVLIHSAPFGPVGALDAVPAYRLAAGTSVPGLASLRRVWAAGVTDALRHENPSFVLDLRSEAYVALGPVPAESDHAYVRVVSMSEKGEVRALNHFNKKAKGLLVRDLAMDATGIQSREGFQEWAERRGRRVDAGVDGELRLFV